MKPIAMPRLRLEPLQRAHAREMFAVLCDPAIYEFLDYGPPQSIDALEDLYKRLEAGHSPDGSEVWLNWVVRLNEGAPIGYVQATVYPGIKAYVAYVVASRYWGNGYAVEAMTRLLGHLADEHPVPLLLAVAEARNVRSTNLLQRLGFLPASATVHDVELSNTERLFIRACAAEPG